MPDSLDFCKICGKNTPHHLIADHTLLVCVNKHPHDDDGCCHICEESLEETATKIAKSFKALYSVCFKCRLGRGKEKCR